MAIKVTKTCPEIGLDILIKQYNQLRNDVENLIMKYNALVDLVNDMKAKFNAHTHTVTHAACGATGAAYGEETAITSTSGPSTTVADGEKTSTTADTIERK